MGSSTSKAASPSSNSSLSASNSPLETTAPRAFSFPMPSIHHLPAKKGDTHHLVSLTSSTYGSLLLADHDGRQTLPPHISISGKKTHGSEESRDSLSPDSVINTWELMNGLDDEEDWLPLHHKPKQPLWKHMSEESFLSDLDPNIISSYKKALSSKQLGKTTKSALTTSSESASSSSQILVEQEPETQDNNKIVLYFTSLRGIRKTYEDCCSVRTILGGFQVAVEERDISMDSTYRKELQSALGAEKPVSLPQVFIRGTRIGGIEEIKLLNDGGELEEMLKEFPVCESLRACESCWDARFVPCTSCAGSTKVFEEQEDGFKRCNGCNENGLVRCKECFL